MAKGMQVSQKQILSLSGNPDDIPSTPSAYDDEFNASILSGWTTLGTLDTLETTTWRSNVHLKRVQSAWNLDGIYKAAPTSYPFTIATKISDAALHANYQHYGILLADSTPTKLFTFGQIHYSSGSLFYAVWNSRTSRASFAALGLYRTFPSYFKIIVKSATLVDLYYSHTGALWIKAYSDISIGFNLANIGLMMTGNDNDVTSEIFVDYIRVS